MALLLALDASCVRIAFLKRGIRQGTKTGSWKAKALRSFFLSIFHGCSNSGVIVENWCHGKFYF